jgi:hypothetical protein
LYCRQHSNRREKFLFSFIYLVFWNKITQVLFFFFFFLSTGAWTQGLYLEPLHQPYFFVKGLFKIQSCKLFAQSSFELPFSWSLPPEYLGLQVWTTGTQLKLSSFCLCLLSARMTVMCCHPAGKIDKEEKSTPNPLPLATELILCRPCLSFVKKYSKNMHNYSVSRVILSYFFCSAGDQTQGHEHAAHKLCPWA